MAKWLTTSKKRQGYLGRLCVAPVTILYSLCIRHIRSDVEASCHSVAIAQVVEHWQHKSEAPLQSRVAAGFSQLSKIGRASCRERV